MSIEGYFRTAFLIVFAVTLAIAVRTARLAASSHAAALNQLSNEVRGLLIVRAALGLVFYIALGTWLFGSRRLAWAHLALPTSVRVVAAVLCVPILLAFSWAFRTLGKNYRGGVGLYDDHSLVTTGPYRYVRHPIYACFIALMGLSLFITANWLLGLSGLVLVLSIAAVRSPVEERELGERFGAAWKEHARRTGAFLPKV